MSHVLYVVIYPLVGLAKAAKNSLSLPENRDFSAEASRQTLFHNALELVLVLVLSLLIRKTVSYQPIPDLFREPRKL